MSLTSYIEGCAWSLAVLDRGHGRVEDPVGVRGGGGGEGAADVGAARRPARGRVFPKFTVGHALDRVEHGAPVVDGPPDVYQMYSVLGPEILLPMGCVKLGN